MKVIQHLGTINKLRCLFFILFVIALSLIIRNTNKKWELYNKKYVSLICSESSFDTAKKSLENNLPIKMNEGQNILIGVIDTPICYKCIDQYQRFCWVNENERNDGVDTDKNGYNSDIWGWNFLDNNNFIFSSDEYTHGTEIESLIISIIRSLCIGEINEIKIASTSVFSDSLDNNLIKNVIRSISYFEKMGIDICCLSMNIDTYDEKLYNVMKNSRMLFVVAAGNDGCVIDDFNTNYPTSFELDNVISVSAINEEGELCNFSNYGDLVDICAPGLNVGILINDKVVYKSGTSFAVPFVAVTAAIIMNKYNLDVSAKQVKKQICSSVTLCEKLSGKINTGGYLNIRKAVYRRKGGLSNGI